ncbi:GNAT family N-acetyltransferase [Shimia aestuarii]|uniref:L-amino acid N-acyltransferase YncA n=1 Tax=Shimia aestuarii TaxID=254406 RepID=A0A1I4KFH9_9RHOB|nr:GNAT family N-acetyltransferase [Shimia aestuarii]SFL77582.1 L-amino acid N-acyltransferase YncA [Shimia aestuarii]
MTLHIRRAGALDSGAMCDLLNEIIAIGGTTALTAPMSRDAFQAKMEINAVHSAWHLAEDPTGEVLGFQWIAPHPELPPKACDIATFVRVGRTGLGTGSALFDATRSAARALGYRWINANIRADNSGGLAYYQSRGFEPYQRLTGITLPNGQTVDKILKRYDL